MSEKLLKMIQLKDENLKYDDINQDLEDEEPGIVRKDELVPN